MITSVDRKEANTVKGYSRDVKVLMVAGFCYLCCSMSTSPIVAGYAKSIGASGLWMGIISALTTGVAVVCRPITGNLSDRTVKFRLVVAGCLLMMAASVGYVMLPYVWGVVLFRCLHGVGYACCSIGMSTWLTMLLPPEQLGSGVGMYGTVNALAMAVAPVIGIRTRDWLGYSGSFLVGGGFALATILLSLLISNRGAPVSVPEKKKAAPRMKLVYPRVLPIAIALGLITIPYTANKSFLVTYVETAGVSVQPDLFFTMYAGILVLLRVSLRRLFDKVTYSRFLLLCSLSMIASLASLYFMDGWLLMLLAALFMAGGYGILFSVSQSATAAAAPAEQRGIAMGTYYLGLDFGSAMGPVIGGVLYGELDIALFYPMLSVFGLLGIGMYFVCKRIYEKPSV